MASRPCHSRFGSPISAGVNTVAVRWISNEKQSLLEPRKPDKRSRAIRHYSRHAIAGWRLRLIRPTKPEPAETAQAGSAFTRHPLLSPPYQLPDGGYALSGLPNRSPLKRRKPDKRSRAIRYYHRHTNCRMAATPYPAYQTGAR